MLKELKQFVDEMKNTSSLNEKKVIIESIKDNKFITKALNSTLIKNIMLLVKHVRKIKI